MNKAEIVAAVQKNLGSEISKAEAERCVTAVIDAIKSGLKKKAGSDQVVQIIGFGTFKISKRAARKGINPKTGESIKIKASKTVKFSAGKALKEII